MIFKKLPLEEAAGSIIAHSYKSDRLRIRKGQILDALLLEKLRTDGVTQITVAKLDTDDVHEDEAASMIAAAIQGDNTRLGKASTGRVNIHALSDGLFSVCEQTINALNRVDESITIATLLPDTRVVSGQIIATIKIIPYASTRRHVAEAVASVNCALHVHQGNTATTCLIQSTLPALKPSVLDKTCAVTVQRLQSRSATLLDEQRVDHDIHSIIEALVRAQGYNPDWILVFGASATSDRDDVVPAAVVAAGGQVQHFGMPMDPGNLLLIGQLGNSFVVGMPGCARSPKHNGVDRVLDRLWCNLPVTGDWISGLGVGGLLQEMVDRPRPRVVPSQKASVCALLLAAGSSSRFGEANKLLQTWREKTLIQHVITAIDESSLEKALLVSGHQSVAVEQSLRAVKTVMPVEHLHNRAHATGMASSLVKGVSALVDHDAIVVFLADMPCIDVQLINELIRSFHEHPDKALHIPVHEGQRGNPVLITRQLFDSVLRLDGDTGARVLAKRFPDAVVEVNTQCAGILQDVDTLKDMAKLRICDVKKR